MQNKGFTLIELIVVVGLMIVLSAVSVNLLFSTIKGSVKAELIKNTRQSGNYTLTVMDRFIRNARKIVCQDDCDNLPCGISVYNSYETEPFDFIIDSNYISSGSADLISRDSGYDITGRFTCVDSDTSPSVVEINFTLSKNLTLDRAEEKVTIPFKTTISLRTY